MRAARSTPPEDLNARALIRDAAIVHFARDGFRKANLRTIAATAGVSASLVMHHFGSKEGLRRACDEHVLGGILRQAHDKSSPEGLSAVIRGYLANPAEYETDLAYLARAISEDSGAGREFVDAIVDETEAIIRAGIADGSMNPSSDPRAVAAVIAMTSLAMMTLNTHLARALGLPGQRLGVGPEVMSRLALPSVELYTHGLYADDSALRVTREAFAGRPGTADQSNHQRTTREDIG